MVKDLNTQPVQIIPLAKEHAAQAAELHIAGIGMGFISSLGPRFVTALYEGIATSPYGFGYVAVKNGQVLGFATWTTNLSKLYRSVIMKKGHRLFFTIAGKLISISTIKKVFETLFYASRTEKMDLPEAELLSIATAEAGQRQGLARKMMEAGFEECHRRGIRKLKIMAGTPLVAANKFYQKNGFEIAGRIENHGVVSNVYVVPTDHFLRQHPQT